MDVRTTTSYTFESKECVDFNLNLDRHNILLGVIYWSPDTSLLQFDTELAAYMEGNINTTRELIIVGDFNVHINKQDDSDVIILSDIAEQILQSIKQC